MVDLANSEQKATLLKMIKEIETEFSRVLIFYLDNNMAFGWVGVSEHKEATAIEELVIPLNMPSCFVRSIEWKMKSAGSYRQLTPCEKGFFNYSQVEVPTFFMSLPLFSKTPAHGDLSLPQALLYVEKAQGNSDQELLNKIEAVKELCSECL